MFKRKRQVIYLLVTASLLVSLTACGSKTSSDTKTKKVNISSETTKTPEADRKKIEGSSEETTGDNLPAGESQPAAESVTEESQISTEAAQPATEESQISTEAAEPATEESQISTEAAEPVIQEVQITELNVTMYAANDVNVRIGDNKDTSLLGFLETGQEVLVTGQSISTGWYRIDYNGQAGFVSNKYLQNDRPTQQTNEQQQEETVFEQQEQVQQPAGADSVRQILDSALLNPSKSGYEPLDVLLANLLPQLYSDSASTYEKVKACYDYLIQNCSYGMNEGILDYFEDYFWGYSDEVSAYGMLSGHVGVCDDYSAAFTAMAREIGLDCRIVGGQTSKAGGGYTGHAWCVITINGTEYVFDAQVEDNIANGGSIQYYRFCKRYDEVPGKYILQ